MNKYIKIFSAPLCEICNLLLCKNVIGNKEEAFAFRKVHILCLFAFTFVFVGLGYGAMVVTEKSFGANLPAPIDKHVFIYNITHPLCNIYILRKIAASSIIMLVVMSFFNMFVLWYIIFMLEYIYNITTVPLKIE